MTTEKRKPKYPFRDFQTGKIFLQGGPEIPVKQLSSEQLKRMGRSANITDMSEVDAKIAAAEARTDTKFAEMMGELRLINQKLEHVEKSTAGIRLNIWLAAATAVGLVVAVFSWGTSMFGVGMDAQTVADKSASIVIEKAQTEFQSINARYDRLEKQIGLILTNMKTDDKPQNNSPILPAPYKTE